MTGRHTNDKNGPSKLLIPFLFTMKEATPIKKKTFPNFGFEE